MLMWQHCNATTWWRNQMETCSALLAICAGNSPVTGEFPSQRPVARGLMFSLVCAWKNGWENNREAGELRRHRLHYDASVMSILEGNYWAYQAWFLKCKYNIISAKWNWFHISLISWFNFEVVACYWFQDFVKLKYKICTCAIVLRWCQCFFVQCAHNFAHGRITKRV